MVNVVSIKLSGIDRLLSNGNNMYLPPLPSNSISVEGSCVSSCVGSWVGVGVTSSLLTETV